MDKTQKISLFKSLISIMALVAVIYLVGKHWNEFAELANKASYRMVAIIIACQIFLIALTGFPFKTLFSVLGTRLPAKEWISLSFASNFANYIAPFRPGLAIRYLFMRKRYQSTLKEMALVTLSYSMVLFLVSALLVLALLPFFQSPNIRQTSLLVFSGILVLIIFAALMVLIKYTKLLERLPEKILKFVNALLGIVRQRSVTLNLILQFIIINFLAALTYYFAFLAFSVPINMANILIIAPLTTLASVITLTPGNIGITESIVGLITSYGGGDFSTGFLVTSLVRVCNIVVSVGFGVFCSSYLMAIVKKNPVEMTNE